MRFLGMKRGLLPDSPMTSTERRAVGYFGRVPVEDADLGVGVVWEAGVQSPTVSQLR